MLLQGYSSCKAQQQQRLQPGCLPLAVYVRCFGQSCYSTRHKGEATGGDSLSSLVRAGLAPETQWAFLQLGIPGGCMMAADASSFDVTTAMAGALGESHDPAATPSRSDIVDLKSCVLL